MSFAEHITDPTEPYERLQKELLEYLDEYELYLQQVKQLSKASIDTRCSHLISFIDYICMCHSASGFEDIKFLWCSSGFASSGLAGEDINTKTSRNYIRDFFVFIHEEYGVANINLLEKLKAAK